VPREGIDRISLKLRGKTLQIDRKVTESWDYGQGGEVFTQRLYLASPGGTYLAYAHRASGALRVRDARGHERTIAGVFGRDVRFSPDERQLATIRSPKGGGVQVTVMDMATGALRDLGPIAGVTWLEWVAGGVVASHVDPENQLPLITLFPLDGAPRQLASGLGLDKRFTSARRGSRVMYFVDKRVYLLDTSNPDAEPLLVGELPATVNNAEMAPDGVEATIATGSGLYRARGEEMQLELLSSDGSIHTVWYSDDGTQLAYADESKAVVLAGEQRHVIETPDYDLTAMRFHHGGTGLVIAIGTKALLWQPDTNARKVLGVAGARRTMQGAELYAGGTVLWSREVRVSRHDQRTRGNIMPMHPQLNELSLAD
jgi:hypothetical protein